MSRRSSRSSGTAKLAYIPQDNGEKKKSLWSKMKFFSDSSIKKSKEEHTSEFEEPNLGPRSHQQRGSSRMSQERRKSSGLMMDFPPEPKPRKSSLGRSSISESDSRNLSSLDSSFGRHPAHSHRNSSSISSSNTFQSSHFSNLNTIPLPPRTRTTVVVHMTKNTVKNSNASSTPSTRTVNSFDSFGSSQSHSMENHRGSISNIERRTPNMDRRQNHHLGFAYYNDFDKVQISHGTRTPPAIRKSFPNSEFASNRVPVLPHAMRREKTEFLPSRNPHFPTDLNSRNWNNDTNPWPSKMAHHHRSSEDILSINNARRVNWDRNNGLRSSKSTWCIDQEHHTFHPIPDNERHSTTSKNSHRVKPNNKSSSSHELNSLQVFRQNKYKDRLMSERKIKNHHHLQQNEDCNELIQILGKEFHPSMYENTNPLEVVQNESKTKLITSSRIPIMTDRLDHKPKVPYPSPGEQLIPKEHIYAEIDDDLSPIPTPVMQRRVTFSTTHNPLTEKDSAFHNKKARQHYFIVQIIITTI